MPRRPHPLALTLAGCLGAGCFVDVGHVNPEPVTASASASAASASATSGEASTDAGTDAAPTTTGPLTTGTTTGQAPGDTDDPVATTSPATTTVETTAPPPPNCGDGVVDGDEQCDDGNQSNSDHCLSNCALASCQDGHANQGESDVDCGGPCGPCPGCGLCDGDADCGPDLGCDGGRCRAGAYVDNDWSQHCGLNTANWTQGPWLPPGVYRLSALGGGGTFSYWNDPPDFVWLAGCDGLSFGAMQAVDGYPSAQQAFDALPVLEVLSDYPGGPLRCGILDTECDDNLGGTSFAVQLACD